MKNTRKLLLQCIFAIALFLSIGHVSLALREEEIQQPPHRRRRRRNETRLTREMKNHCPQQPRMMSKGNHNNFFLGRLLLLPQHSRYIKMAYQMAVLSYFAYYEFHKAPELPQACKGFQLKQDLTTTPITATRDIVVDALIQSNIAVSALMQNHNITISSTTTRSPSNNSVNSKRHTFQYSLYNWKESGVANVRFHDTDILISTSNNGKELIIAFGGTASAGDLCTNLQTFESANHSSFFQGGEIEGSLHRGFLNAYSKVDHGYILPLGDDSSLHSAATLPVLKDIHNLFMECEQTVRLKRRNDIKKNSTDKPSKMKLFDNPSKNGKWKRRRRGCHLKRMKLSNILRQIVTDALLSGITVHVTGHSLGGALATLLAGDVVVNHPSVSVKKLHVWVYGSPQLADDTFLHSAMNAAPRLKKFLRGNGHFNRFVTLSRRCEVDVIVDATKIALSERRKLGGVHGSVVHFAEPFYLFTDAQSSASAHELDQYIKSLAEKSKYPLGIDLPSLDLSRCMRES